MLKITGYTIALVMFHHWICDTMLSLFVPLVHKYKVKKGDFGKTRQKRSASQLLNGNMRNGLPTKLQSTKSPTPKLPTTESPTRRNQLLSTLHYHYAYLTKLPSYDFDHLKCAFICLIGGLFTI